MAAEVTPVTARPPVRSQVSPPARPRRSLRRKATSWLRGAIIVIVCVVALFPVYWMVLTTFQPSQDSLTYPPDLLPHGIQFGTITSLFANNPIASWLLHSLTASAICVAITLIFAVPGAYLLSRLRWHGVGAFGFLLLFTQLMPGRHDRRARAPVLPGARLDQQPARPRGALRGLQRSAGLLDPEILVRLRTVRGHRRIAG